MQQKQLCLPSPLLPVQLKPGKQGACSSKLTPQGVVKVHPWSGSGYRLHKKARSPAKWCNLEMNPERSHSRYGTQKHSQRCNHKWYSNRSRISHSSNDRGRHRTYYILYKNASVTRGPHLSKNRIRLRGRWPYASHSCLSPRDPGHPQNSPEARKWELRSSGRHGWVRR